MNSFAIWYNGKENKDTGKISIELHFNLWKLKKLSSRQNKDRSNIFLDIGIKVKDITNVNKINIFIPFRVNSIEDIGIKMKDNRKLINGIFNDDCEIRRSNSQNGVTISRNGGQDIIKIHTLDSQYQKNYKINKHDDGTIISIITKKYRKEDTVSDYFRFRIKIDNINRFGKLKKDKYNFFKPSYEINHIIDFRVNEKRALPENLNMLLHQEKLFKIEVIHFLLLMDTDYRLACTGLDYSMRALEDNLWSEYLDNEYKTECLVGYHWKQRANLEKDDEKNNGIENFNSYIRIKESRVNLWTIFVYLIGVIILGAVGSIFANFLGGQDYRINILLVLIILIISIFMYSKSNE